eukprot:g7263.t1
MKHSIHKFTNRLQFSIRQFERADSFAYQSTRFRVKSGEGNQPTHSDSLVRDALKQLDNYCSLLPKDGNASLSCWEAREYFAKEALSAEQKCDLELNSSDSCSDFDDWESFVRQVECSGGVKQMVKTILAIKHAKANEHHTKEHIVKEVSEKTRVRKLCESLFLRMDKNHDGRIDVEEFRTLMKLIGDELNGETVSVIFDALDIHGSLDFDQLITIIEAEAIRSHSQTAGWLRLAQRHGHSSDIPKWIQNV